jgi:hypothetical protein
MLSELFRPIFWMKLCTLPPVDGAVGSSPRVEIWRHRRSQHLETRFHFTDADTGVRKRFSVNDMANLIAHWRQFLAQIEKKSHVMRTETLTDWLVPTIFAESNLVKDGVGRSIGQIKYAKRALSKEFAISIGWHPWDASPSEFNSWLERLEELHQPYITPNPE